LKLIFSIHENKTPGISTERIREKKGEAAKLCESTDLDQKLKNSNNGNKKRKIIKKRVLKDKFLLKTQKVEEHKRKHNA
jgi:hypothetical protein